MYVPVWLFFFIPGVAAGLASVAPWIIGIAVLWGLAYLAMKPLSWIMDDTWKTRRDAARRLAPVGTYAVSPPRIGEPGWMAWAIAKKWDEDCALAKARRMPTSRRALTGH